MIDLLVTIALTTSFYLIFKAYEVYRVKTFQAIFFNYVVCVITGVLFTGVDNIRLTLSKTPEIIWYALLLGFLFISVFYLMALAAQRVSVSASTISSRVSMVIPVLASLLVFRTASKEYTFINYFGIVLIVISVALSALKKRRSKAEKDQILQTASWYELLLVPVVFIGSGMVDTMVNLVERSFQDENVRETFPVLAFFSASLFGGLVVLIRYLIKKEPIQAKSILGGIVLGVPNYFSIFFLMGALRFFGGDGAYAFPLLNVGVILTTSALAMAIYKERLNLANKIGISIAVVGIVLLSYQEIFRHLF